MLNPFPIQFLALFAYFILRIFIGTVLLLLGFEHWRQRKALYPVLVVPIFPFGKIGTTILILSEITIGTMYILGFYTQIAALFTILLSIKMLILRNRFIHPSLPSKLVYFLFLGIGCSLFITGAGILAFDLPI